MFEAHRLAGQRGSNALFSDVRFVVEAGEALIVTGVNGSGKTTLLRMLAGLAHPDDGEIRWNGQRVEPLDPRWRRDVLYCGHSYAIKRELSAAENLAALAELAGESVDDAGVHSALDEAAIGLQQRALPARSLSAGQQRRIGLARLRLVRRALWVLDEPATALDAAASELLSNWVGEHLIRGGVAVVATHQPLSVDGARVKTLTLGRRRST
ncbi:MAG TPA: cytochrome c biogenesis heme-transporting ATPase CcmA [Casimicrobiaceae bacterium]|nr:cytochrome c biogenesis heme-transporting ATPase CcmA [Casimicrobiaceae bacterium]